MAPAHREQLGTDVDNNESYVTKEKEDNKVFGRCKRADCQKKRTKCVTATTFNLFTFKQLRS